MNTRTTTGLIRWLVAILVLALALPVAAKDDWHTLAELQAVGEAKEVVVNRTVSSCELRVLEGSVTVNTLVIREGGKKTFIPITRQFEKGEKYIVDLGPKRLITGFRISDGRGGKYRVSVR